MNERTALAVVDRDYGSIEDFAISLLGEKREALDESLPLTRRAEIAELPVPVFARVISSPNFRALIRMDLVNSVFGIEDEREHIMEVGRVARGGKKTVVSASGKVVDVDQAPGDIIAAGKYLNELRGTPIEKRTESTPSVVINIGGTDSGDRDDAPTIDIDVESYRPQRAGDLPPPGIQSRSRSPVDGRSLPAAESHEDLGSLYGEDAEEEAENRRLAEKSEQRETAVPRDGRREVANATPRRRAFLKVPRWKGRPDGDES